MIGSWVPRPVVCRGCRVRVCVLDPEPCGLMSLVHLNGSPDLRPGVEPRAFVQCAMGTDVCAASDPGSCVMAVEYRDFCPGCRSSGDCVDPGCRLMTFVIWVPARVRVHWVLGPCVCVMSARVMCVMTVESRGVWHDYRAPVIASWVAAPGACSFRCVCAAHGLLAWSPTGAVIVSWVWGPGACVMDAVSEGLCVGWRAPEIGSLVTGTGACGPCRDPRCRVRGCGLVCRYIGLAMCRGCRMSGHCPV